MNIIRSIALTTAVLVLAATGQAQIPYQSHEASLKIYATGDLAFGIQEKPAIALECGAATGRFVVGSYEPSASDREELTVVSGKGAGWAVPHPTLALRVRLDGRYTATLGSTRVDVLAESGDIRFSDASPVLEAIRLNPDTLTVSISDRANTQTLAVESFRTSGVDICRFAYACGNQKHVSAACGASVRPPSPTIQMLKRDIEVVLDRYPNTP